MHYAECLQNNLINIEKKRIGLPLEKTFVPFYFILEDGKAKSIFIPDKSFPEYTDYYLKLINIRYLSKR